MTVQALLRPYSGGCASISVSWRGGGEGDDQPIALARAGQSDFSWISAHTTARIPGWSSSCVKPADARYDALMLVGAPCDVSEPRLGKDQKVRTGLLKLWPIGKLQSTPPARVPRGVLACRSLSNGALADPVGVALQPFQLGDERTAGAEVVLLGFVVEAARRPALAHALLAFGFDRI